MTTQLYQQFFIHYFLTPSSPSSPHLYPYLAQKFKSCLTPYFQNSKKSSSIGYMKNYKHICQKFLYYVTNQKINIVLNIQKIMEIIKSVYEQYKVYFQNGGVYRMANDRLNDNQIKGKCRKSENNKYNFNKKTQIQRSYIQQLLLLKLTHQFYPIYRPNLPLIYKLSVNKFIMGFFYTINYIKTCNIQVKAFTQLLQADNIQGTPNHINQNNGLIIVLGNYLFRQLRFTSKDYNKKQFINNQSIKQNIQQQIVQKNNLTNNEDNKKNQQELLQNTQQQQQQKLQKHTIKRFILNKVLKILSKQHRQFQQSIKNSKININIQKKSPFSQDSMYMSNNIQNNIKKNKNNLQNQNYNTLKSKTSLNDQSYQLNFLMNQKQILRIPVALNIFFEFLKNNNAKLTQIKIYKLMKLIQKVRQKRQGKKKEFQETKMDRNGQKEQINVQNQQELQEEQNNEFSKLKCWQQVLSFCFDKITQPIQSFPNEKIIQSSKVSPLPYQKLLLFQICQKNFSISQKIFSPQQGYLFSTLENYREQTYQFILIYLQKLLNAQSPQEHKLFILLQRLRQIYNFGTLICKPIIEVILKDKQMKEIFYKYQGQKFQKRIMNQYRYQYQKTDKNQINQENQQEQSQYQSRGLGLIQQVQDSLMNQDD